MKKFLFLLMSGVISTSILAEKLYVGTNAEFVPYEYLENGKLTGFDIELMEIVAQKSGYEIVWKDMSFDGLIPALQTGKIDAVIAGMAQTPERQKAVDFSNPYLYFDSEHLVLVNEKSILKNKGELKDKIVGVQLGSMQEEFAKNLGANVRPYNSFLGALMDLENNKIDGVIIADKTGYEYLKSMKTLKILDKVVDQYPGASIAFKKGSQDKVEKINKALNELKDTSEYNNLVFKYFPEKKK
ncbi:MAG: transporter substrate-binding domain-containing protein [Cetobacterium sp.]|uniref:transporter substrate-binding domain-containing protein n=1 Tax=Cetobacterium sp. TaxID=2071632 RepID=UPI003F3168D1